MAHGHLPTSPPDCPAGPPQRAEANRDDERTKDTPPEDGCLPMSPPLQSAPRTSATLENCPEASVWSLPRLLAGAFLMLGTRFRYRAAICLVIGLAPLLLGADADESRSALERDPQGWTDLLARAGPQL